MSDDSGLTVTQARMRDLALAAMPTPEPTVEERVDELAQRVDQLVAQIEPDPSGLSMRS